MRGRPFLFTLLPHPPRRALAQDVTVFGDLVREATEALTRVTYGADGPTTVAASAAAGRTKEDESVRDPLYPWPASDDGSTPASRLDDLVEWAYSRGLRGGGGFELPDAEKTGSHSGSWRRPWDDQYAPVGDKALFEGSTFRYPGGINVRGLAASRDVRRGEVIARRGLSSGLAPSPDDRPKSKKACILFKTQFSCIPPRLFYIYI